METCRSTASVTWCSGSGFGSIPADRRLLSQLLGAVFGFAICADMIYRRVWTDYRGRIDLAVVSAAWPDFADRESGRRHWLLGHVGPLSGAIPAKVAMDLGVPVVFANQCGVTHTTIPVLGTKIEDRFSGQSSICDGRHGVPVLAGREPALLIAPITLHHQRGLKSWRSMSPSVPAGLLFRLGTFVIGIWGGLVYRLAYHRRTIILAIPGHFLPLSGTEPWLIVRSSSPVHFRTRWCRR